MKKLDGYKKFISCKLLAIWNDLCEIIKKFGGLKMRQDYKKPLMCLYTLANNDIVCSSQEEPEDSVLTDGKDHLLPWPEKW